MSTQKRLFMKNILFIIFCLLNFQCSSSQAQGSRSSDEFKVLIVGDSLMGGNLGIYLLKELNQIQNTNAIRKWKMSTGLSGYKNYNWTEASFDYIHRFKPDILIVCFGANDGYAVKVAAQNKLIYLPSPASLKHYALKVRLFLHSTAPYVKKVYWIGLPALKPGYFSKRYPKLNKIFQDECSKVNNAEFIDSWTLTSKDGQYLKKMADRSGYMGVMHWDEVHYSMHGGKVLGEMILEKISSDYSLQLN